MTCERLSDRMPLVAANQSAWTDEERRHLATCADCSAEWRVVVSAAAMGRDVSRDMDLDLLGQKVIARLAAAPASRRRVSPLWYAAIGVAAGLLLLLGPWRTATDPAEPPGQTAFEIPMMELDSLNDDQLRMVLEAIDEPLATPTSTEVPSTLDLDDTQLERVLRSLEG
jgi:hypothetical protein